MAAWSRERWSAYARLLRAVVDIAAESDIGLLAAADIVAVATGLARPLGQQVDNVAT